MSKEPQHTCVLASGMATSPCPACQLLFERGEHPLQQKTPHCPSCTCGKRAPVQGDGLGKRERPRPGFGPGSVAWHEHELAWSAYSARYGGDQSAERIAERGGFSYGELVEHLGARARDVEATVMTIYGLHNVSAALYAVSSAVYCLSWNVSLAGFMVATAILWRRR